MGIYTPVKTLKASTRISVNAPDNKDKKARLTGLLFLESFWIIINAIKETARMIKKSVKVIVSHPDNKNRPQDNLRSIIMILTLNLELI